MEEMEIARRRFTLGTAAALSASLSGCLSGDDSEDESGNGDGNETDDNGNETDGEGNGDGNETDDEESGAEQTEEEEEAQRGSLVVFLEDENGDPVSEGITFKAVPNGEDGNTLLLQVFTEGEASMTNVLPGSYTATAEGDGFETAEDEMTIEAGEETELTLVLEKADGGDGDE
ncbi:PEGA domain-containing protein [Halomontanus rarus]|uniref:PEGA domain-containing protein n=1 Tax=Halomontanus rarus TaxID=3034020 RepID=UPI001A99AB0C